MFVDARLPPWPLAFFEPPLDVPEGWCDARAGFVLLSDPYRGDAERAGTLGRPVVERLGGHLDLAADPDGVADRILGLIG